MLLGRQAVEEVAKCGQYLGAVALHSLGFLVQHGLGLGAVELVGGNQGPQVGTRVGGVAFDGFACGQHFIGQHAQFLFLHLVQLKFAGHLFDDLAAHFRDAFVAPATRMVAA